MAADRRALQGAGGDAEPDGHRVWESSTYRLRYHLLYHGLAGLS